MRISPSFFTSETKTLQSIFTMENPLLSITVIFPSLLFILTLFKFWKKSKTSHSITPILPPGPRKLPVIGNMHQLFGNLPHRRLRELANKYGSIMHLQIGEVSTIVISSSEAAKQVLKTHDLIFAQRPFNLAASILFYDCTDIGFAYGDYWRQMRKICTVELLSVKRVQSFRSIREEEVSDLISTISSFSGKAFNFSNMLYALTTSIAARATFGEKCKDQEGFLHLVDELIMALGGFSLADLFPSNKLLPVILGTRSKLMSLHQKLDRILGNIFDDHKARKKTQEKGNEGERETLLDVLLRLKEHGDLEFPLTIDNIKAVILEIFSAGSDTSSSVVEWAMSELLRNPKVMQKAQEEVRRIYGDEGNVDESKLHELEYLKLIIKETMRIHPPGALLVPRESRERCEINCYEIPAKTRVIVNAWALGRDPNYWEEAETFYPERFVDSSIDYKGNNFEYMPFGAGRRMCPGLAFGIANIELQLAQFLYHFDWKLADGMKAENLDMIETFGSVVRRKNDLYLIAIPHYH